jgi:hypothetical protein
VVFKNCFRYYTKQLKRRLPAKVFEEPQGKPHPFLLTDEQELAAVYIINTCEYCLETIPKLQQQLEDAIEDEYKTRVDLMDSATDTFRELINTLIRTVILSIEARNEQLYSSILLKQNWLQFEEVLDTSDYIKKVSQVIQARVLEVKGAINTVYANLFVNKVVGSMT